MPSLSDPLPVGTNTLSHRMVMAPLTRYRANSAHVHGDLAIEYYSQRASVPGTLILTEATFISPRASGYANVPGIYNEAQIAAWKKVTEAVHEKGSFIWCQLWALGRAANPEIVNAEAGPDSYISSSPTPMQPGGPVPREMTEKEILGLVDDYVQAGKNAMEAGFDGVEIHGANGYLIDQFTQSNCNHRTDSWGGSVPARSRFALTIASALVSALGAPYVGIRLSPFSTFQGMKMPDQDIIPQFSHLIAGLRDLKLAYVHLVESRVSGSADAESTEKVNPLMAVWGKEGGPVLLAGGFRPDSARRAVEEEYKEYKVAVVFGRYFISNPDLPFRVLKGLELENYNRETFYVPESSVGYVDYPFSKEWEVERKDRETSRL